MPGSGAALYRTSLAASDMAKSTCKRRTSRREQVEKLGVGFAPDSFSVTYEQLLKAGFQPPANSCCGLRAARTAGRKIYDRFRIVDCSPSTIPQGGIVGFGDGHSGTTTRSTSTRPTGFCFTRATSSTGLHHARDAIRASRSVLLVEGYFDVLACHRAGAENAVATLRHGAHGRARETAPPLRRHDHLMHGPRSRGQDAMERRRTVGSRRIASGCRGAAGQRSERNFWRATRGCSSFAQERRVAVPGVVIEQLAALDLASPPVKREALRRILRLLSVLPMATERSIICAKPRPRSTPPKPRWKMISSRLGVASRPRPRESRSKAAREGASLQRREIVLASYLRIRRCVICWKN